MESKRWVQHISGQGEKWEVITEHENDAAYRVKGKLLEIHPALEHYLPKSEYIEVPAPERWVDVTEECSIAITWWLQQGKEETGRLVGDGYRLRKVQTKLAGSGKYSDGWAFIVERKKQP